MTYILFEHSIKDFESFKYFKPVLFRLLICNWYFSSYYFLHVNELYQYLVHDLLDQVMNLFFQIQNLQLWIFYMDFWSNWIMSFYIFFCNIIKVNHFCIILLYCYIWSHLFHLLKLCSLDMVLPNQWVTFFYHHLNLKQSY